MWIRRVIVPGLTDGETELRDLRRFIDGLNGVDKVEVLPYHRMGVFKWQQLGLVYPLDGVLEPSEGEVRRAKRILIDDFSD